MNHEKNKKIARVIALLVVIGISVTIFLLRDKAKELAIFGYPGIFLIAFLSYATVLLPAPGVALVFTMGAVFNPIGVSLAAGAGAALGELSGYLAGFSGQAIIEKAEIYNTLSYWMKKNGAITILILSAIPNPFFDIAGVAAGVLKMPMPKFIFWCWVGQTIKMAFFAFAGSSILE